MRSLYRRFDHLVHELAKFGVVGAIGFVIDVGLFNLLMFAGGDGPLNNKPLTAKAISVIVAMTFAYFANRHWTWGDRERTGFRREYLLFFLVNGVALLMSVGVLWFSHYVLDLTSPLDDNIAANVIGLGLGTIFRFYAYRRWVFPATAEAAFTDEDSDDESTASPVGSDGSGPAAGPAASAVTGGSSPTPSSSS